MCVFTVNQIKIRQICRICRYKKPLTEQEQEKEQQVRRNSDRGDIAAKSSRENATKSHSEPLTEQEKQKILVTGMLKIVLTIEGISCIALSISFSNIPLTKLSKTI